MFKVLVIFIKIRVIQNSWRHNLVNKQLQYTLPNISGSKINQAMKFCQLIDYNKRNAENEAGRLVRDLFLLFKYT